MVLSTTWLEFKDMAQDPDVTRGLTDLGKSFTLLVGVFSHQSADYSIVVAHLTSNSFERHPCCMHADYLPSLSDILKHNKLH
jgi:hypothetical protein